MVGDPIMVAIIDYDAGNIKSVEKAIQFLGEEAIITRNPDEILSASHVILPGVGAFGDAMEKLHKYGLISVIHEVVKRQIPFLGICLGLQLFFERSEETPGVEGLGILKGEIKRIPAGEDLKIPHIGWNALSFKGEKSPIFKYLNENDCVYFVHSYYGVDCAESTIATCEYGIEVTAAVQKGNVFGCQFHPEKSSKAGLKILKNFTNLEI